ncbi:MAG: mandelate racemase/muconate lactonizing enzyme family protein [Proteobacteria bacterium]|nr:mandelate racemase/muconate lactonizing enzyme family protein [Pseudomonadota bacterium]
MDHFTLSSVTMHFVRITHKTCWTFLRLHTADGRIGEGEASLLGKEDELAAAAERLVPLVLLGKHHSSSFAQQHPPESIQQAGVVSALDQALWSLHAQSSHQSLAQTLGIQRHRIPVYANINRRTEQRGPDGFADSARAAMAAGHRAFKLAPFDEVNTDICAQGDGEIAMQAGLARIAAVRDAVGPAARLMVDCHWRFDEATAVKLNEAAARLGVYWIETPLPEELTNIPALARLRRQCNTLGLRQSGLEMSIGWDSFRPYCEGGAYDVVMPDIKYVGGIDELQRTTAGCAALGVQVSPHNPSGPICHGASLQVASTLDAFDMLELQFDESLLFDALVNAPFAPIKDGHTELPAGPGLGVVLDEAVMTRHTDRPVREWHA